MTSRKEFWETGFDRPELRASLFVDTPYCKAFQISQDELDEIRDRAHEIVSLPRREDSKRGRIFSNRTGLLAHLNKTRSFSIDVANNLDLFVQLENSVISVFSRYGVLKGLVGCQFPMDVRVVHAAPPPGYLERRRMRSIIFIATPGGASRPMWSTACSI